MQKIMVATALAITLLIPNLSLAFDWFTIIPTITKYITDQETARKGRVKVNALKEKIATDYDAAHQQAFADLKFMATWQEVAAHANAISTAADQILYVEPLVFEQNPTVTLDEFFRIVTTPKAKALLAECERLSKRVHKATDAVLSSAFQSTTIRQHADALVSACDQLSASRGRIDSLKPSPTELRAALPEYLRDAIENDLNAYLGGDPDNPENQFQVAESGEILVQGEQYDIPRNAAAYTGSSLSVDQKAHSDELTKRIALQAIWDNLLKIKLEANFISDLTGEYFKTLFKSLQKAQVDFARALNKDADKFEKLVFPDVKMSKVATDVLGQIKKGLEEEKGN